jgi:hypothetical protein
VTPRSDVDVAIVVSPQADAHAVRLDVIRASTRHLGTDTVDVVVLNSAPVALAGRILTTRRVLLDRVSLTAGPVDDSVERSDTAGTEVKVAGACGAATSHLGARRVASSRSFPARHLLYRPGPKANLAP